MVAGLVVTFLCDQSVAAQNMPYISNNNSASVPTVIWPTSLACPVDTEVCGRYGEQSGI